MSQEELDAMLKSMAIGDADYSEMEKAPAPPPRDSMDEKYGTDAMEKGKKPLVQRVEFTQLKPRAKPAALQPHESLFNNIPLVLSGELGTAELTVRELLALEEGSVIKLDKIAGESATVLVNEQFLGHAETVVVNDRFGLRITTIGKEIVRDKKENPEKENVSPSPPPSDVMAEKQAED